MSRNAVSLNSADSPLSCHAEVRPSPIHGCGVFARTLIPAGTPWWKATVDNVLLLGRVQLETLAGSRTNKTINGILNAARVYGYYSNGWTASSSAWTTPATSTTPTSPTPAPPPTGTRCARWRCATS